MIFKSYNDDKSAWSYISEQLSTLNENESGSKTIIWNQSSYDPGIFEVGEIRRIFEAAGENAKQFVVLMGGPSSGKGFLVNTKFGEDFGLISGRIMKDWLDISKVNMSQVHEGDAILREIQRGVAIICFNRLYNACIAAGKSGFLSAITEMYYVTKDGNKNSLGDHLTYKHFMSFLAQAEDLGAQAVDMAKKLRTAKLHLKELNAKKMKMDDADDVDSNELATLKQDIKQARADVKTMRSDLKKAVGDIYNESEVYQFKDFVNESTTQLKKLKSILYQTQSAEPKSEDAFEEFFDATNAQFWKSMRGWKSEGSKGMERFKEAARREFEKIIKEKPDQFKELDNGNIIVVDSPGEDVAKQPYVAQCAEAEKAGFVTNIINLDPRLAGSRVALMRLSNFTRNIDEGDRMVDDSDITGYVDNVGKAIDKIQNAQYPEGPVHRYFHLYKNIEDVQSLLQIIGALYGTKKGKDAFIYPKEFLDSSGEVRSDVSQREFNKYIKKTSDININLANKLKSLPTLLSWWRGNVRKIIFGIDPVVLYEIKGGEDGSFNIDVKSSEILLSVNDRLKKTDDRFKTRAQKDYTKMVKSVDNWNREYTEWNDADTWNALRKITNIKESRVKSFDSFLNENNNNNGK